MFKNLSIYDFRWSAVTQGDLASRLPVFQPPGQLEKQSYGFSPVREGSLVLCNHNQILLNFTREKKVVPGSAVKTLLAERRAALEEEQGFAPGKVQTRELKERVVDELTARALTSRTDVRVWIDPAAGRLLIDSTSKTMIDLIVGSFVRALGLELAFLPKWPGAEVMGDWLFDDEKLPAGYTIDDAIKFERRGAEITYRRSNLSELQAKRHLSDGAGVASMAMSFEDKLSFVLTPEHQLRSIRALDVLKERQVTPDVDRFENDFILMTGELSRLIDSLIENA